MNNLEDIKNRLAAATPGPWRAGGSGVVADREYVAMGVRTDADAEFIAHAPEDIARLVKALEAVRVTMDANDPGPESGWFGAEDYARRAIIDKITAAITEALDS